MGFFCQEYVFPEQVVQLLSVVLLELLLTQNVCAQITKYILLMENVLILDQVYPQLSHFLDLI